MYVNVSNNDTMRKVKFHLQKQTNDTHSDGRRSHNPQVTGFPRDPVEPVSITYNKETHTIHAYSNEQYST